MTITTFSTSDLDSPAVVQARLVEIEMDLAERQNPYERVARRWYDAQREIRKAHAIALLGSLKNSVTEKKAEADLAALVCDGAEHEAEYEAAKAALRVLETRAMICTSILKSQGRGMSP